MKMINKKILSLILALVILVTSVPFAFAQSVEEWNSYWKTADAEAGIIMFNGEDDSKRNFTWYFDDYTKPAVRLSTNSDMKDYTVFWGDSEKTYDGKTANKVTVSGLEKGKTYYFKVQSKCSSFKSTCDNESKPITYKG